jgi:F-type H+-transporting ATPase subunit c
MKALKVAFVAVAVLLVMAMPVLAQEKTPTQQFYEKWKGDSPQTEIFSGAALGAGLGAAFIIIGAGYGFGRIGSAALEGMARQPEVAPRIQVAMIIIAALLEGATFFALLICLNLGGVAKW